MSNTSSSSSQILFTKLAGLVIFNSLRADPAINALCEYHCGCKKDDAELSASSYAAFVKEILLDGGDFTEYLYKHILFDDNIFIRKHFAGEADPLMHQLSYELGFLAELTEYAASIPSQLAGVSFPEISYSHIDFEKEYLKALPDARKRGVGVFARSAMFRVNDAEELEPVLSDNGQRLSDLVGYKRERRRVIENTEALMNGKHAANALLYGDAGTGKSSTVKAIVREYANEGLRLIELDRSQIMFIPKLMAKIAKEPLKFIIFIDDLALSPDSPDLCALKNVLEGGAGSDRSNCVIYVTSNHRHLVKESAADRNVSELNVQDNLQGVLGLSARFGLAVTFLAPDRELYLEIVRNLAEEMSVPVTDQLLAGAEAFAIRRNGRSPRCAKQYVELIASGIDPIK